MSAHTTLYISRKTAEMLLLAQLRELDDGHLADIISDIFYETLYNFHIDNGKDDEFALDLLK